MILYTLNISMCANKYIIVPPKKLTLERLQWQTKYMYEQDRIRYVQGSK